MHKIKYNYSASNPFLNDISDSNIEYQMLLLREKLHKNIEIRYQKWRRKHIYETYGIVLHDSIYVDIINPTLSIDKKATL